MARNKSWDEIRRAADLNEAHVEAYGRLHGAEERFYEARQRRGFTDAMMARALGLPEDDGWAVEAENSELFIAALGRHVAAAGGHLELRAVFADEAVVLLREPGPGDA